MKTNSSGAGRPGDDSVQRSMSQRPQSPLIRNRLLRSAFFAAGLLSLVLGILGAFLPLLPTTPFLLLAAGCFFRSSPRFHDWLVSHPRLGQPLKDWESEGAISKRAKTVSLAMILGSLIWIWLRESSFWIKPFASLILFCSSCFILTRPHPKRAPSPTKAQAGVLEKTKSKKKTNATITSFRS